MTSTHTNIFTPVGIEDSPEFHERDFFRTKEGKRELEYCAYHGLILRLLDEWDGNLNQWQEV